MSLMTSMWTQTLAQVTRGEERTYHLFTPHIENDIKNIVKKNMAHQSRDTSGWDFDKKFSVLSELQDMIEVPCFKYVDWGEAVPARARNIALLPLVLGQEALLDLWTYLMEFCEVVPVRTGARGLFLRLAGCICRRLEFNNHVEFNGIELKMDLAVESRYYSLLEQSLHYCSTKLSKSRILTQDHAYFSSHIFTTAFYRFPSVVALPLLNAIDDYANQLRNLSRGENKEKFHHATTRYGSKTWLLVSDSPEDGNTSASSDDNNPNNSLDSSAKDTGKLSLDSRKSAVLHKFRHYKSTCLEETASSIPITPQMPMQSTSIATLELVFQSGLQLSSDEVEAKFITSCPQLYAEPSSLIESSVVEAALSPFLERIKKPSRDSILFVIFLSTFLEDSVSWNKAINHGTVMWHCIPGYFNCIQAFVQVFKKVCMRRKKRDLHIIGKSAEVTLDPWFAYWTTNELEPLYDGLSDILGNGSLLNVFVQIILESTNLYDPHSVDYSFNVLQNVFECAAECNGANHPREMTGRGHLPLSFDVDFYLIAIRKALTSTHFQILLKVLAFLYATADLLESKRRQKLLSGVVLHEHFFLIFLHWNEEVRRMFCHLLVYKLFLSSRLHLPLVSDRVLLANSPFFRLYNAPQPHVLQGLAMYFTPQKKLSPHSIDHSTALERLIIWDTTAVLKQSNQKQKQEKLFRESLADDELMLDLSMTSKLDALMKMIADQIQSHDCEYYPKHLQVYAKRAIGQYISLLWGYYQTAFDDPSTPPPAPILEFNVQNFFGSSD